MSSSLIRGKYIIGRVIDNDRAEVIEDGAIFQRDGKIVEIGTEGISSAVTSRMRSWVTAVMSSCPVLSMGTIMSV
jgi:cytosine/adenosine deaminase-related metal-dependent hydrolase